MKFKYIIANLLFLVGLSSCGMTTLSKADSRFSSVLGKKLYVKEPIYLYEISPSLTGDSNRYPLSSATYTPEKVVAVLGVGHPVVFEAVETSRDLGAYTQRLVGYTEVKSKRYPITYYVGMGGDGWKVGIQNYFISPLQ
jgi:hypothetical protein